MQIINTDKLSKKYRTNVPSLIRAWKKGVSDLEISYRTGVDLITLNRIKSDIELAHRRARLERKRGVSADVQLHTKRHILLRPLM
ncbi:hypothetical protein [Desulfoscipio geothermicus]|uniref:Uncharacterized protein n=1 Tax=Desulfoscipio geothermicus DSM 3669 TaxID=1121426 RepID=A0A1I6DFI0_9FIRM|nr:hypothetical protein [Desulfoscipio geothermicus]SFR04205.1 hypothetical protein SAMN05660706_11015 [Desulfoscipio geothermicus DSM 3669]